MKSRLRNLMLSAVAIVALAAAAAVAEIPPVEEIRGPYVDEVILPVIVEPNAQILALQTGEIHINPGLVDPAHINLLAADPNVDITMDLGFHMFYMSLNMRRPPFDDVVVRRALAHAIDREEIILSLFDGYMLPLAESVPPSSPFHNPDTNVAHYDPALAEELLDAAGYVRGPDGIRIDPSTGEPMRTFTILTPTFEEAPTSAELGIMVAEAARSIGLPMEAQPLQFNTIVERILGEDRDFDAFGLAWSLGRFPTHLYTLFHSQFDVPGANNTPGLRDPEYDAYAERVWRARDFDEAMEAAFAAQEIWSELQPYIPLYSRPYIDAFRSDLVTGYVPHLGYGAASNIAQSPWTILNIRRVDRPEGGGTLRFLLDVDPGSLNPLVPGGTTAYSSRVQALVLGHGLIVPDPVANEDVPWLAESWEVDTWTTPEGKQASMITVHLRDDVYWHDGVPFTAHDIQFTMEYLLENKVPNYTATWQDYAYSVILDDYTIRVYFNELSYWHLYNITGMLPRHIWAGQKWDEFEPWNEPHPTVEGLTKYIGTGPFIFQEWVPGEYVRVTRNPNYFKGLDR